MVIVSVWKLGEKNKMTLERSKVYMQNYIMGKAFHSFEIFNPSNRKLKFGTYTLARIRLLSWIITLISGEALEKGLTCLRCH